MEFQGLDNMQRIEEFGIRHKAPEKKGKANEQIVAVLDNQQHQDNVTKVSAHPSENVDEEIVLKSTAKWS